MLGCGKTNHLQSLELYGSGTTGVLEIKGWDGTLQLQAIGAFVTGRRRQATEVTEQRKVAFRGASRATVWQTDATPSWTGTSPGLAADTGAGEGQA